SQDQARIDRVVDVVDAIPETADGLISALGWVAPRRLKGTIKTFLEDESSATRRLLGLAACSVHRVDANAHLARLARDDAASVRARALRLIGELGAIELSAALRTALEDEDETCRFWAAWSACLTGERDNAFLILRRHAEGDGPFKWRALDLLLRAQLRTDVMAWLSGLNDDPGHARLTVTAAGILGDPRFIPWLIDKMALPDLARPAGESFTMITGIDLAYDDLDTDAPNGHEPGPTPDPGNSDVDMDPDEDLPWPDPTLIQSWWQENAGRFTSGHRYFLGHPCHPDVCRQALMTAYQRQRRAAALDLAMEQPSDALFNCRQVGKAQKTILGQAP
ncbi:MAG: TIGR02270 family protein, partial [Geminicoccaceae bacterium]